MNNSFNNKIISGSIWTILSRFIQLIIKGVSIIFLARMLSVEGFGSLMLLISISIISTAFIDIGVSPATARLLAEDRHNKKQILNKSLVLLLTTSFFVIGICYFGFNHLAILLSSNSLFGLNIYSSLLIFLLIVHNYLLKVFEGSREIITFGKIYSLAGWLPWFMSCAFLLLIEITLEYAIIGYLFGYIILDCLLSYNFFKYYQKLDYKGKYISYRKILRYALPMIATTASFYIYTQSDVLLIQYFVGEEAVGIYSAAIKLVESSMVGAMAIGSSTASYFPIMKAKGKLKDIVLNSTKAINILYLPIIGVFIISSSEIISILYGSGFELASIILIIYSPYLLFRALSCVYSLGLDYLGYADQRALAVGVSAILNILLNIVLIPYMGIKGAAIATQITYSPLIIGYSIFMMKSINIGFKGYIQNFSRVFSAWILLLITFGIIKYYFLLNNIILATIFISAFMISIVYMNEVNVKVLKSMN